MGQEQNAQLELGEPIEWQLTGGLSHFYKITMASGQFLRIVVKQQGIDVAVALSTPDGKKIAEADIEHVRERNVLALSGISPTGQVELFGKSVIKVRRR